MGGIDATVQSKVVMLRDEPVLIDCDLAELYQIEPEQIRAAIDEMGYLPEGYCFKITRRERKRLILNHPRLEVYNHPLELQLAFPEKGLYLLAPNLMLSLILL